MHSDTFNVRTSSRGEMQDITSQVRSVISDSGIDSGQVIVWVPHTTAGVTVNENADPDVTADMLKALEEAVPWNQRFYQHGEGNSAAHVKSSLVGCSLTIPLIDGRMPLGTWQGIYFCEFDGPRSRKCTVTVIGE
jgi:secondary thiamine-phosphate synthase enzyme